MMNLEHRVVSILLPMAIFASASCAAAQTPPPDAPPKAAEKTAAKPADKAGGDDSKGEDAQQKLLKQLQTEAQIRDQELATQLAALKAENDQLKLANDVAQQKQTKALQQLQAEKAKLEAELAVANAKESATAAPEKSQLETLQRNQKLREAKLTDELAGLSSEHERLKQMREVSDAKLQAELAANKAELERARVAEDMLDMKNKAKIAELKREQDVIAAENALAAEKRRADQSKILDDQARAAAIAQTTNAQILHREAEDKWRDGVNEPVPYTDQPFKDGVLTVSDRRIDLNGPIVSGTADYVCDRIDFFNNKDRTKPIFIVINNSPGGSVMEGYRILKAIQTSDAPVHVVVKSFAASMAATIATLAPHSYAYPNAIILHHQMSSSAVGNMTDIEQEVKTLREWERRLAEPIAQKMGITLDEFKARMYSARKSGDWDEFADKAVALKWIDNIVNEIREEGVRKKPTERGFPSWMFMMKKDEQGKPYVALPPLEPYDCYFMINPHNFYRVEGR